MSPTWLPTVAAAIPAASDACVTSRSRATSSSIAPTARVVALSACRPSRQTPTSTETIDPSRNTFFAEGMPWTISVSTDVQRVRGKP